MFFLLFGGIEAPDNNVGFVFMFLMALVMLCLVIWEGIK
jgi:hypothetical protein